MGGGGGQGLDWGGGGQGGPNSQQAHYVVLTSMRRNDVASTSFRRHVPTRFLINQCQIIIFFILKSDNIQNSRELKGIVLQVPSNQIKVTFIIYYYFALQLVTFVISSCFTQKLKTNVGGLLGGGGGGGPKGMLPPPPSHIIWGACTCTYLLL